MKCKCGQEIVWVKTKNGKKMPINVLKYGDVEIKQGDVSELMIFDPKTMVSHFATCPMGNEFRKK